MFTADGAVALAAAGFFALAAVSDMQRRLIPNALPLGIAVLAVLRLALAADLRAASWAVLGAAAVFAAGALCFARGWIGGGDVKLAAAATLFIGIVKLPSFLLAMSLAGALLSLSIILARRAPLLNARLAADDRGAARVPYGVAIAAGVLWVLSTQLVAG